MALTSAVAPTSSASNRPKKVYPVPTKGLYPLQLFSIDEQEDTDFNDKSKKVMKVRLTLVVVDRDNEFYGSRFWLTGTPTLSKASGSGEKARKESNLHKWLKEIVNGGEDFSDEMLEDWLENFVDRMNALVDTDAPDYRPYFVDATVVQENTKEDALDENGKPTGKKRKRAVISALSATDEVYEPYEYVAPPLDPRTADEDDSLTCEFGDVPGGESCDNVVYGFARSDGTWYEQADWVEFQRDKNDGHIFCGRHYKAGQAKLKEADDDMPF